jgi:phytoene synthase
VAERLSHCAAEVRRADRDRFLVTLFAPAAAREALFALYAFNHEVAKVRETVSEPMLGQVRLQWWREAIDGLYAGKVRRHPVVEALAETRRFAPGGWSRTEFERLIDAREFDLAGRAPADLAELEGYCAGTSSSLLRLAGEALGADAASARALDALGIGWALAGLVRAIPFHARARRQYVPAEIAAEAGLGEEALFALAPGPALDRAVERLAAAAARRLDEADAMPVEPAARPLMLYAPLARAYLARLRRRRYDVRSGVELSAAAKVARLWWAARTRLWTAAPRGPAGPYR